MIVVYHNENKVVELTSTYAFPLDKYSNLGLTEILLLLAKAYPETILVWCHIHLKEQLNVAAITQLLHHKKLLLSYNPSNVSFLDQNIGYVDASLFTQANKEVTFPTWQMSSAVGVVYAEVLLVLQKTIPLDANFDYFLCSLAKLSMPKGLLCYSEPRLLRQKTNFSPTQTNTYILFRFVKQHYKTRWIFLLLFNMLLYERNFLIVPFLSSLFYKNRSQLSICLDSINVQSSRKVVDQTTVDVIIPTIGRKEYLKDVLKDFSKQTLLPKKIIIVEQNPAAGSSSELDYIQKEKWPFEIQLIFIHQAGACNARNLALDQTQSEWVFLADDDIRIASSFIQKAFEKITDFGAKAVTMKCYQKGEKQSYTNVFQWGTFGSGCSFVCAQSLRNCEFRMGYEFGFGEDGDFGMQMRHHGQDILYLPEPEILHLKAPIGGFRTKPILQWQNDSIQPKPSPTIMLYQILHNTTAQTNSYKTTLFLKYYKLQRIINPFLYYIHFQKQWRRSVFWANELKRQNEI